MATQLVVNANKICQQISQAIELINIIYLPDAITKFNLANNNYQAFLKLGFLERTKLNFKRGKEMHFWGDESSRLESIIEHANYVKYVVERHLKILERLFKVIRQTPTSEVMLDVEDANLITSYTDK